MKYANTFFLGGKEIVVTVLPLSMVPFFDPTNPIQSNTYGVPDAVQVGWVKNAQGVFEPPAPPTLEEAARAYLVAVQKWLDADAAAHGYDNIVSACSYAAAPNAFQAEGISFLNWRAAVWAECYRLMAEVQAATIPAPTLPELLAMLPTRVV